MRPSSPAAPSDTIRTGPRRRHALSAAFLALPVQATPEIQVEGPPPQDPGLLLPLLPAVLFLLLAALTWWLWRKLAE